MDEVKKRRRGPAPRSADALRTERVSVYFTPAELSELESHYRVTGRALGRVLRDAALNRQPPSIPALNLTAWAALSRSAANLNQIAHALNVGEQPALEEIRQALEWFRADLVGVKLDEGEDDEG